MLRIYPDVREDVVAPEHQNYANTDYREIER